MANAKKKQGRPNARELGRLRKTVALATRMLFHQGLADYHGHVSARVPGADRLLIKPVLAPLGSIRSKDVMEVDIAEYKENCEANWARAGDQKAVIKLKSPPRETMIHAAIYEARPDVQAVVHTHQPLATAFAIAGVPIRPIYNQAAAFAPETPIFHSPRLIYTVRDGVEVAAALGDRMAVLMQGHGVTTVGDSVEQAACHAVYLERTAYMQWVAGSVGQAVSMPDRNTAIMAATNRGRAHHAFAYFTGLMPEELQD